MAALPNTSIEFVLSEMERLKVIDWKAYDKDEKTIGVYSAEITSVPELSRRQLAELHSNFIGVINIRFRPPFGDKKEDYSRQQQYWVMGGAGVSNQASNSSSTGIGGGGVSIDKYLELMQTNMALQNQMNTEKLLAQIEAIKTKDNSQENAAFRHRLLDIGEGLLAGDSKAPAKKINGVGGTMQSQTNEEKKARVLAALSELGKGDEEIADKLEKLAELKKTSPFKYKMAVAKLMAL